MKAWVDLSSCGYLAAGLPLLALAMGSLETDVRVLSSHLVSCVR